MMDWSFFPRVVMLTADPAEYVLGAAECARVGLTPTPYHAVREIGPHQSFSHSERNILLDFLHSADEVLLHLEDDVVFRELSHLPAAISELPSDWDILYLGANLVCWDDGPEPEHYSEHLWRIRQAWTTHAVAYHRRCVRQVLEQQPGFDAQMFDNWLGSRLGEFNAYVVSPMVAWQRARHSSIWDRWDDYGPIFEASEARLR